MFQGIEELIEDFEEQKSHPLPTQQDYSPSLRAPAHDDNPIHKNFWETSSLLSVEAAQSLSRDVATVRSKDGDLGNWSLDQFIEQGLVDLSPHRQQLSVNGWNQDFDAMLQSLQKDASPSQRQRLSLKILNEARRISKMKGLSLKQC